MEKKFTKGKWEDRGINCVLCEDKLIAHAYSMDVGDKQAEYNAKLIAAAPELLEALTELYDSFPDRYSAECLPKVRNVIKKATE